MLIYLWKISQGLVQGYSIQFTSTLGRRGSTAIPCGIVKNSSAQVKKARASSIGVRGARIFNMVPLELRNMNGENVETFKKNLDTVLLNVLDLPTVSGLGRAAETSSLLHQSPLKLNNV